MSGTQLKRIFTYHPQMDGQSEVINYYMEQYLLCFIYQQPRQWSTFLPWVELWYNTAYHSSTSMTPIPGSLWATSPYYSSVSDGVFAR